MASSTVLYTPGNAVVVTHVLPAAPNREQQPSLDRRHNFRKGHPKALGIVQIMIGALTLLFGIATAAYEPSLTVFTGMFVWAALIYITSGALTVAAEKHLSRRLINTSLAFNIIAAMAAVAGVFLYAFDPVFMSFMSIFSSHDYYGGYSFVVAVFQLLELIISITVAGYACHATCGCCSCGCTEEPQVFFQAVEGTLIPQAPPLFQAASVAPAQPYPQVAPNVKNPGFLGSAEPPAYSPY